MRYLIVTADDLGLTKSINEGIAKACSEGVVTAVSVIPTGEAFEDAIKVMSCLPVKDIGAHLALTETTPLLSSSKFYKNHTNIFFSLVSGRINKEDIYQELKAQLERLKKTGLKITHINSHEHVHLAPQVLDIFIRLAREYNIPAIRFPRADRPPAFLSMRENYRSILLSHFARRINNNLRDSGLAYTDFFIGLLDAGKLDIDKVKMIVGNLKEGVTELVTHPGFLSPEVLKYYKWHKGGETELFALTDNRIKKAIRDNDVKLITYGELSSIKGRV